MIKPVIYQIFTRLFGNSSTNNKPNGTIVENGCGKMNHITADVLNQLKSLGITHVWYTGIIRHATTTDYSSYGIPLQNPSVVKGRAGSPYAIVDYYDVDPDLACNVDQRMEEFKQLVSRTHQQGLKVIIDFVPNHVARQYCSIRQCNDIESLGSCDDTSQFFAKDNNFYYLVGQRFCPTFAIDGYSEEPARATGNDCFSASPSVTDWYETIKLNYGENPFDHNQSFDYDEWQRLQNDCDNQNNATFCQNKFQQLPRTWRQMLHILMYWASIGVDAFRCDMAEMIPITFWQWALNQLKAHFPNIVVIGEVYNPQLYRSFIKAGFDWLYDKVGMYDTLRSVVEHDSPASSITKAWQKTDDVPNNMLYFLENHDEQRIASRFFASEPHAAFPAMTVLSLLRQNPVMIYFAQELGEDGMQSEGFSQCDGRTTIFDYWSLQSIQDCYFDLKTLPDSQSDIYMFYKRLLSLCQQPAIAEGLFFDLTYANSHISKHIFCFLRKKARQLLLVCCNFSSSEVTTHIHVPTHAFDIMRLNTFACAHVSCLLTGDTVFVDNFSPEADIKLTLPAYGSTVLELPQ